MNGVYDVGKNQTQVGQLNGTVENLSVGELGSVMINNQINDIAPSIFKKIHGWASVQRLVTCPEYMDEIDL